jgi:hypothetical protein
MPMREVRPGLLSQPMIGNPHADIRKEKPEPVRLNSLMGDFRESAEEVIGTSLGGIWKFLSEPDPEKAERKLVSDAALKERRLQGDEFGNTPQAWIYNEDVDEDPNKYLRFVKNIDTNAAELYRETSDIIRQPEPIIGAVGDLAVGGVLNYYEGRMGGLLGEDVGVEQREMATQFATMVRDNFKDWDSITDMIAKRPLDFMGVLIGSGQTAAKIAALANNPAIKASVREVLLNMPDPADVLGSAPLFGQFFPNTKIPFGEAVLMWHGTKARFTEFDMAYIGTGEGNQMKGYGIYLGGTEGTSKTYMSVGDEAAWLQWQDEAWEYSRVAAGKGDELVARMWENVAKWDATPENIRLTMLDKYKDHPQLPQLKKELKEFEKIWADQEFSLMKVDISQSTIDTMIDDSLPIWEQPQVVQDFLRIEHGGFMDLVHRYKPLQIWSEKTSKLLQDPKLPPVVRENLMREMKEVNAMMDNMLIEKGQMGRGDFPHPADGEGIYNFLVTRQATESGIRPENLRMNSSSNRSDEVEKLISLRLQDAGILGRKYLDEWSTKHPETHQTYNAVSFSPENQRIIERNGVKINQNQLMQSSSFKRRSDGSYVGFAPAINTPQKLNKLITQLDTLAKEGKDARFWYEQSSDEILKLTHGDKVEAEKIAQILAIMSQGANVKTNTGFAFKAYAQHKAGMPIKAGRFPKEQSKKITDVLNGIPWEGRKTNSFYGNLMTQIDPAKVLKGQTTQDMWMARAFGLSGDVPSAAQYQIMEDITQSIAKQNGWQPHQAQAAIWVAVKARNDAMKGVINKHIKDKGWGANVNEILPQHQKKFDNYFQQVVYDSEFNLDEFVKASYSFADGIEDNLGFINLEAVPGTTTNFLPGIINAAPEDIAAYTKDMYSIFLDEKGVDLLAKEIGIVSPDGFMGFGGWAGDINPNVQVRGIMSGTIKGGINPADVQLVELYAAVVGTVFKQDGVSYRRAFFDETAAKQNGVDLDIGRKLTKDEHQKIYDILIEKFGHDGVQPTSTGTGAQIIQYRHKEGKFEIDEKGEGFDMPNKDFQKLVRQAIIESDIGDVDLVYYRSDGKLIENNWKENPNGESYKIRENSTKESQNLYQRLVDKYSQEAGKINTRYSEDFGWGEKPGKIKTGLLSEVKPKPPRGLLE